MDIKTLIEQAERIQGIDEYNPKKHDNPVTVPATQIIQLLEIKNALLEVVKHGAKSK